MATLSSESFFQIRMILMDEDTPKWRRLLVPSSIYLSRLSGVLQYAMGWLYLRLHEFVADGHRFGELDSHGDEAGVIDEKRVKLDRLLNRENASILYEYDFGDGARRKIAIELEKVLSWER